MLKNLTVGLVDDHYKSGYKMKECIVILGMHRSGTSVLTGLVSLFGGYVGADLMPPTKDNPMGYFENNKIYVLNERILRENNASWHDYSFVADDIKKPDFQQYVSDAKDVIQAELKFVNKLIIKDPRICILFPIWEQALQELDINIRIIFAYRSPLEVAHSLLKRDEIPVEKGLMLWSHYFLQSEVYSRKYQRMIVEYDKDFHDLPEFLDKVGDFIGADVNQEIQQKAKDLYSPNLKHHQVALDNISDDLPSYLTQLITLLVDKKLNSKKKVNQIRVEFNNSVKYYQYKKPLYLDELKDKEEQIAIREMDKEKQEEERLRLEGIIKELKVTIEEKSFRIAEALELKKEEIEDKNHVIVRGKEKLKAFEKNAYIKEKDLITIIKEREHQIKEQSHGLELLNSVYKMGDQLFQKTVTSKKYHKQLHNKVANVSKLKLRLKLLPFAKKSQKRLLRDRISIIQSGLFSPFFYLTINPDVKESGIDPLIHFCKYGWKEGRNPSLSFDTTAYLKKNPDVDRVKVNPLVHYIRSGKKEGRKINSVVLYGKRGNAFSQPKKAHSSYKKQSTKLLGPISENYWDKSLTALELLERKKKVVNGNIPSKLLEFSKEQLADSPIKISVIMPTWNRENSICQSLDSILEQSYLPFEIIVSDDGSTDGTIQLLKQNYEKQISEGLIQILQNEHQGVSATRNSGLEKATGELIAYLDSDNIWRQDYLLIMAAAFSENDELNCAYAALERHDKNDENNNKNKILAKKYNRKDLLNANFIDLNVFVHKKSLYRQCGGFDTKLKRLVDWELIIKYTKYYQPALIPFVGVDYILDDANLKNITTTVSLDDNRQLVYDLHFQERLRYELDYLRIAYVLWDFPALSQTFVMEEIKWLVKQGYDVVVYFSIEPDKVAILDFEVDSYQVKDADQLTELLIEHQRNLCHSHFAYPTATKLTYPACVKANIPFTFMPHAVDIFHNENKKRNNIGEISRHPLCLKVLVHGEFHKRFIEDCGVPSEKIAFNIQAVNVADFTRKGGVPYSKRNISNNNEVLRGVLITRFVEKKGINTLIDAAALLKNENIVFDIYGYGPLEEDYKKQIEALGVDNVILKGALNNQQDVAKAYQQSDFLITPCVVADNGDMDGFPTVILEAMAMGLPVITTDIAAIPDYLTDGVEALVTPAGDVEKLAESVLKLKAMSRQRIAAMVKRSQQFLDKKIGVKQTMQMLLDTWHGYTLEIFLVTFNTEKYEDSAETYEIIKRIFKYTTTPFTLTIIDNNSDDEFWLELCKQVGSYPNIRLIRKTQNLYCGPSSNIALELSDSEFGIYICSKEGFIKSHGWERPLLEHMRNNPNDALAGHHAQMPKYIYGKEYINHPDFAEFRIPEFAQENPERVFKHVQGGVFIIRRDFVAEHGGFNPATPHGGMDIEMSYFVESLGYELGEISEVASLTTKTRPTLTAITSERTVIAHPLTVESVKDEFDSLTKENGNKCNICGWQGKLFIQEVKESDLIQKCPECQSTGFGRSIMKVLANNLHIYRGETCMVLSNDKSMQGFLSNLFNTVLVNEDDGAFLNALQKIEVQIDFCIIDPELIHDSRKAKLWEEVLAKLAPTGEVLFADGLFEDDLILRDASTSTNKVLTGAMSKFDNKYTLEYLDYSSYCIAYDWRRIGKLKVISTK
ncbi:MAG: glycosyltransferase [Cocleimonas sp.]